MGAGRPPATLRWGGVVNNVACAMGARGAAPVLATVDYSGELGPAVADHLERNGVEWLRLPARAPLQVFQAELVEGSVASCHVVDREALRMLTPELLGSCPGMFRQAAVIAAGTDCEAGTLAWLREAADSHGVPFWLLSADRVDVGKLTPYGLRADFVALNLHELTLWADAPLPGERDVTEAARRLAAPGGRCLVTMGERGSLLVAEEDGVVLRQRASAPGAVGVTVGAGDVLFGCLLAFRLAGLGWERALRGAAELTGVFLSAAAEEDLPYRSLRPPGRGR